MAAPVSNIGPITIYKCKKQGVEDIVASLLSRLAPFSERSCFLRGAQCLSDTKLPAQRAPRLESPQEVKVGISFQTHCYFSVVLTKGLTLPNSILAGGSGSAVGEGGLLYSQEPLVKVLFHCTKKHLEGRPI